MNERINTIFGFFLAGLCVLAFGISVSSLWGEAGYEVSPISAPNYVQAYLSDEFMSEYPFATIEYRDEQFTMYSIQWNHRDYQNLTKRTEFFREINRIDTIGKLNDAMNTEDVANPLGRLEVHEVVADSFVSNSPFVFTSSDGAKTVLCMYNNVGQIGSLSLQMGAGRNSMIVDNPQDLAACQTKIENNNQIQQQRCTPRSNRPECR